MSLYNDKLAAMSDEELSKIALIIAETSVGQTKTKNHLKLFSEILLDKSKWIEVDLWTDYELTQLFEDMGNYMFIPYVYAEARVRLYNI